MLFASTMTRYEQDFLGYHRAYDATTRQIVCEYKIDEAGEQLAVEESGTRLIISTRRSKRAHSLWLFDARTRDTRPIVKVDMVKFDGYVPRIAFSNDGIYLAVARSDNTTHVYDSRFLSRQVHEFHHDAGENVE